MKRLLTILALTGLLQAVHAQDVVFSQAINNPLYLNPSHTGLMEEDNRITAFYRDQWRSVSSPYMTTIISYERKAHASEKESVGVGIHVFYDRAGDGNLSTLKIDLSGAYGMELNEDRQFLSFGFRAGYGRRSVDMNKLIFGSQGGDPAVTSGESFNESFSVFDFGVGLALLSRIGENHELTFGIAVDNLSNPENSFMGLERSRFVRASPYLHADVGLSETWFLMPGFYFANQNASRQYLVQLLARFEPEASTHGMAVDFGAYYRVGDAIIPSIGFSYAGAKLGFSYDVNISSLSSKGAFELSLGYGF